MRIAALATGDSEGNSGRPLGAGDLRPVGRTRLMAILAGLLPGLSMAADEDLYFTNLPVVATVSRLPQALADAPGSVTVIDREMIRASGVRTISDLLRLVPGFQVTPPNTDAPRVAYHGMSNEDFSPRVQVLIDGRSQYSPLFLGGVNWNTLPVALEDIARIEVVRGSNSAAYGSNAFLGVVNIITLDASQARGVTMSASHGTQGVRDEFLRWGGRAGNADFRLTVKQQADEGYSFRPQEPNDPRDIADSFRQRQVDFRIDLPLSDRDQLQLGLGGVKNRLDVGRSDTVLDPPRQLGQANGYLHAEWRRSLDPDQEIGLRYFHAEEESDDNYHAVYRNGPLVLPFSLDRGGRSWRDDLEFQHILKPAEAMRLVWGAGARRDRVRQKSLFFSRNEIIHSTYRLFGNLEWRLAPQWLANVGGNWENDDIGGTTLAPRLNLSFQPMPGQTVRLGASRSYRTPSAYEAYGDQRLVPDVTNYFDRTYLAVPGMRPERIDSLDIGYLGDFTRFRASLDVRAFVERIADRSVVLKRALTPPDCENNPLTPGCGYAGYAVNGQRAGIHGVEYQWRWQPLDGTRLLLNQAFVRIYQSLSPIAAADPDTAATIERQTIASAPQRSTTAMLMQKLPYGVEFSATHHWVREMRWTSNSLVPAYRRLDWRLAYPFRFASLAGEVAFVSQSANGEHAEFKETRIVKERHWLTLRLDL